MCGGTDQRESVATIHAALHQGINLIDTAPRRMGFCVIRRDRRRGSCGPCAVKRLLLHQNGLEWRRTAKSTAMRARARIMQEVDDSLRRLGTDYIDISTRFIGPTLWCR